MIRKALSVLLLLLVVLLGLLFSLDRGWFGRNENAGSPQAERVQQRVLDERLQRQRRVAGTHSKQILFGDLHVHTTFSYDAFVASLPTSGPDSGPHTVADACDFARHCSALDFWSVTDHAEQITPRMWRETVTTVQQCNALAGFPDDPDLVTFLGWEWTGNGPTPARTFAHENVILKDLDPIPEAPIAAPGPAAPLPSLALRGLKALAGGDSRELDLTRYLAEVDAAEAVREIARDPAELFSKLDNRGLDALVIPHARGEQLPNYHDSQRQALVEVDFRRDSIQYLLAMTDFSNPEEPRRLDFGFIAASDNHSARPGAGYKEFSPRRAAAARFSGGLVAVHADSRRRGDIWAALQRRETYATTGPRILLWFDLHQGARVAAMGSRVQRTDNPTFSVRALGSFAQKPGCPGPATEAAGRERLQALCQNECYHPSDQRRRIERIEIVRIRPQQHAGEAIDPLIEDAWRVAECPAEQLACEFTFTDEEYAAGGRDTLYYARAIEAAGSPGKRENRAWSSPIFVHYAADQD